MHVTPDIEFDLSQGYQGMGPAMFNTRLNIRPRPPYIAIVQYGEAKNNGGLATKLKTQSTKWSRSSMKGSILYLPRSILAHRGYSKVSL